MELLNDGIHNCRKCEIYKKYRVPCSLQPELQVPSCQYCDTRMCCRSPFLALMECEQNTILDRIDEGEYIECKGIIPFNIKTRYCKHMDMETMDCKVYSQRPIACRIAGYSCLGGFWVKYIKERHEKNKKKCDIVVKTLQEINDELAKVSEEYSKLLDKEQELKEEKKRLLAKEILDNKTLNIYKWEVEKRNVGFALKPIFDNDSRFDDMQTKLDLYPHGGFQLSEDIELYGDDGDLYIVSSDINAGIEFIKSQDIKIIISKDIINDITSMEKQLAGLKEFVNQFDIIEDKVY